MSRTRSAPPATDDATKLASRMATEPVPKFTTPLDPREQRIRDRALDRRDIAKAARAGRLGPTILDDAIEFGVIERDEANALRLVNDERVERDRVAEENKSRKRDLRDVQAAVAREVAQHATIAYFDAVDAEARRRLGWPAKGMPTDG